MCVVCICVFGNVNTCAWVCNIVIYTLGVIDVIYSVVKYQIADILF